ncbi:MAG: hypothetical protein A2521_05575 [Deltaproteobacteria bacterium RIFOXYD12_FULL_57_12]|nr:MAG: hypothetical protein A2521_05575 [Deltaproteobacteria bacterium RIFOXYD12_FULL_57_12]
MKFSIGTKITGGFLLVILLMGGLAYYAVSAGEQQLQDSIGQDSKTLVEVLLKRINRRIFSFVNEFKLHTSHYQLMLDTLAESNAEFERFENIEDSIGQRDLEWTAAREVTPFMKAIIDNRLSTQLRKEFFDFSEQIYTYPVFSDIIVTNRYGANIAQTGRTSDYRQDDEEWWKTARDQGSSISNVEYDENSSTFGVSFALRVNDPNGNFQGVLKVIFSLQDIIARQVKLTENKFKTTEIMLFTDDGKLIYRFAHPFRFLEDQSGEEFFKYIQGDSGYFIARASGRQKLYAFSRSGEGGPFRLQWCLMVSHDLKEIMAPASFLTQRLLIAAVLFMGLGIVIALLTAHSITRPLVELIRETEIIGRGDLDYTVALTSYDEIGDLAAAFNQMTVSLRRTTASRNELEREIAERLQAEARLAEKNKELEQIVYITSHDLRSPLVNVQGFSRELEQSLADLTAVLKDARLAAEHQEILSRCLDKDIPESLRYIRTGITKMDTLLAGLLKFSRLGRAISEVKEIDMNALLAEVAVSFEYQIKETGARLEISDLPPCMGDAARINQVFANLIDNSLKYCDQNRPEWIKITGQKEGDWYVYRVEDNGIGVAPGHQDKVFELFYRLDPSRTKGDGLGLSIVRKIMEMHRGTVTMVSELGQGCKITLRFPG